MTDTNISQDGGGFIVGVEPARPQTSQSVAQPRPDQAVSQPVQVVPQQPNGNGNYRWTDEDIENARKQEKDKLYPRLDELGNELKTLKAERDAEAAERQRLADEREQEMKAKEESEMEIRDLLARREAEMRAEIDSINQRYETDRAVFERERTIMQAREYRQARIEQEGEFILPELRDLIRGDTPEEVDASIAEMRARSEAIFENMRAAVEPQPFRGAAMASVPPVGPMEQLPSYEQLTPEDIRTMSMDDYKRYRESLLRATSPRQRGR